ncbi:hypothetical protein [Haladaptatus sp. NG-WS-4]
MATANSEAGPNAELVDAVEAVSASVERTKRRELDEARRSLRRDGLTAEQHRLVAELAETITTRLTAESLESLRVAAECGDRRTVETGARLFERDAPSERR